MERELALLATNIHGVIGSVSGIPVSRRGVAATTA
eukprot:SAG31_NODE_3823_length_3849_cov_2.562133_4_plen_35_part_00